MGMIETKTFDPGDPMDAMAHEFKNEIAEMIARRLDAAVFREMSAQQQLECFLAGTLTGIIGASFAFIAKDGRDVVMDYIRESLPYARRNAEAMIDGGPPS